MTAATLALPTDLAPSLRAQVEQLVAECGTADDRPHPQTRRDHRDIGSCHVCHRGGRMGGHHLADGTIVHVHKACHRRLHRAARR